MFDFFQLNNLAVFLIWLLASFFDYSEYAYLWQLKEYRLDRFKDFLSTARGKKFILDYKTIVRPFLFLLLIIGSLSALTLINTLLVIIVSLDLIDSLIKLFRNRWRGPKFTVKACFIYALSLLTEILILSAAIKYPLILIFIISRFLLSGLAVFIINLPATYLKKIYIKKAAAKLSNYPDLTVIGITGSYGKTTVKNFVGQILSKKLKVIITPENVNTDIGIAKFILRTAFDQIEIFIVEMGAYRLGEIKSICDMVKPRIGILTAINEQHLSLFGSLKNTQTVKYELLRSLPEGGTAIVNHDNQYCREFLRELKCRVLTYGRLTAGNIDCYINKIQTIQSDLEFTATIKNGSIADDYQIKTKIAGEHNAMNIASAILTALRLGLSKQEITEQAKKLKLPKKTLQIYSYGRCLIIDDSYNANPDGFAAALKYLSSRETSGKKIVITRGMLELGEASDKCHLEIGKLIAETADELIIISPDFEKAIKQATRGSKLKVRSIFNIGRLLSLIKNNKSESNLILLENRVPELIFKELTGV